MPDAPPPAGLVLPRIGIFAHLSEADRARLVEAAPTERHPAGDCLMRQGEPGDCAYYILDGEVRIDVDSDLGASTVAQLGPGELVGELAAFTDTMRIATVSAISDLHVLRIGRAEIADLLTRWPDIGMALISGLGARIEATNAATSALTRAARALTDGEFDPAMLDALTDRSDQFAHLAGAFRAVADEIREQRRLAHEMATAEAIQRAFLPDKVPRGPLDHTYEIAASMTPARNVGGDFYDFFMIDEARLAMVIGDVSGKGIPAAIFMSYSRIVTRVHARGGGSAGAILARANDVLSQDNAESMFVTLAVGLLDLTTGAFTYASGAHEETFLLPARGREVVSLGRTGPALGLFPGAEFETQTQTLGPGDALLFATDGVTEAFDSARVVYGRARLEAYLAAGARDSADSLVDGLVTDVASFVRAAPPSDDLTLVALVFHGPDGKR